VVGSRLSRDITAASKYFQSSGVKTYQTVAWSDQKTWLNLTACSLRETFTDQVFEAQEQRAAAPGPGMTAAA
jgi:hypothetical protein